MATQEESLYVDLSEWKQKSCDRIVLQRQNTDTVRLSEFHNTIAFPRIEALREAFRDAVGAVVQSPVEHFDQEREFL